MDEVTPHIDVRAVHVNDAPALYGLDCHFETDRILTLRVQNRLMQNGEQSAEKEQAVFAFELLETAVDPPLYKDCREYDLTLADTEARLRTVEGGYVALADGKIVGGILLNVEEARSVTRVEELIVARQFRRYGIDSLLLKCASDWARERGCWAITLETQNIDYPTIQFYLRNGLEIWSIHSHFYPPGYHEHENAILMGKRLSPL